MILRVNDTMRRSVNSSSKRSFYLSNVHSRTNTIRSFT